MNINIRRLLASVFIIIFIILTPPLIMITGGYLYNLKKNKFEKIGLLIINSEPDDAEILFNGGLPRNWWSSYLPFLKNKNYQTPARINYLPPNEYQLTVTKPGFYEWNNLLNITGGTTTFLEYIKLWPKQIPVKLISDNLAFVNISPNNKLLAYHTGEKKLFIFDQSENDIIFSTDKLSEVDGLFWNPEANQLLSKHSNGWSLINLNEQTVSKSLLPSDFSQPKWTVNNIIYGIASGQLKSFNTKDKQIITINLNLKKNGPLNNINTFKNEIWGITKHSLVEFTDNDIRSIFTAPNQAILQAIVYQDEDWVFITTAKNEFLRFNKNSQKWQIFPNRQYLTNFTVINENNALWWNEFEIGIINLSTLENRLITRFSESIIDILPISEKEIRHYLIVTKNKVLALDRQIEHRPLITNLFELNNIISAKLDSEKSNLLLITRDKDENSNIWQYNFSAN